MLASATAARSGHIRRRGGGARQRVFAFSVNVADDNCRILILPMPFFGCAIGKIEARGDLFKWQEDP
jgi:hypothetical protein